MNVYILRNGDMDSLWCGVAVVAAGDEDEAKELTERLYKEEETNSIERLVGVTATGAPRILFILFQSVPVECVV